MQQQIAIVDYGVGNLHSIDKALKYVAPQADIVIARAPQQLARADRVVLPGVGGIRDCMAELEQTEMSQAIRQAVTEKPTLAICVGMQALYGDNEEDTNTRGLAILDGCVKRLPAGGSLKVPHMGWNQVHYQPSSLWDGIPQDSRFYFVHSYYCVNANRSVVHANCNHGMDFDAAVVTKHVVAFQFHPEKSHSQGLQLLKNFVNWQAD